MKSIYMLLYAEEIVNMTTYKTREEAEEQQRRLNKICEDSKQSGRYRIVVGVEG
jgi:hypothetical protein